jgi:hypothetical protein
MAQKFNLSIDAGSAFKASVTIFDLKNKPYDLEDYTIDGQIRRNYVTENVVATFDTIKNINPLTGNFIISIDANTTATINAGSYVYDVIIAKDEDIFRVLEGAVKVTPRVTRDT